MTKVSLVLLRYLGIFTLPNLYFIAKKCYGATLKRIVAGCTTLFDNSEITSIQSKNHAKILFTKSFVIASLNVILPEENTDISSSVKAVFIDILKVSVNV